MNTPAPSALNPSQELPTLQASEAMPDMTTRTSNPEAIGPTPSALTAENVIPIDIVVDDGSDGFSTTGTWFSATTGQQYGSSCAWAPRGIQNIAYFRPNLPQAGLYEVFAWWCGDPNHDQTQQARLEVIPAQGQVATDSVVFNLQQDAGSWQSLGIYPLRPGAGVNVVGALSGNIVADAVRFVHVGALGEPAVLPTPTPTPFPWTNHPPTPLEQLTAGDLTARLGIVQPRFTYAHTPVKSVETRVFDDCAVFVRPDCGGERPGWTVVVGYQTLDVVYHIAQDYRHVVIEPNADLALRQALYLYGSDGNRYFRVDVYPDAARSWHGSVAAFDATGQVNTAVHQTLDASTAHDIADLAARYGPLSMNFGDATVSLYGSGPRVALSDEDAARLVDVATSLFALLP